MKLEEFFSPDGPLAAVVGNRYHYRPEQVRLASVVENSLRRSGAASLCHAPTGSGKSFGGLVPVALAGEKAVVATATRALQEQLVRKDLPVLQEAVGLTGKEPPTFAVAKGRSNYLCRRRWKEFLDEGYVVTQATAVEAVLQWEEETATGDKEDLPIKEPDFWSQVAADSSDCNRATCRFADACHYFRHKDRAQDADIIVANHALLFANIVSGGAVFDMSDRHLIIDEAHRAEDTIAEAFGRKLTRFRVRYVCGMIAKKLPDVAEYAAEVSATAEDFFNDLFEHDGLGDPSLAPPSYRRFEWALLALASILRTHRHEEGRRLLDPVNSIYNDLASFYGPLEPEYAHAVVKPRRNQRGYPTLQSWLVDPSEVFRKKVLRREKKEEKGTTVRLSATLQVAGSFDYVRRRLGFDGFSSGPVQEFRGAEIFDFRNHSLVYVARDMIPPTPATADQHTAESIERAAELCRLSGGRALILLATWRALQRFKDQLSLLVDYPIRFQGDASPSKLAEWLRETEGGILVGTRTFAEGVDIAGPALSLVVVDKVAFPLLSDPVIERLNQLAGKRAFGEVSLPRAAMALQQGIGRLIRTDDDTGVIAILDSRIDSKGWGAQVRRCLPVGAPVTFTLDDVATFYRNERRRVTAWAGTEDAT